MNRPQVEAHLRAQRDWAYRFTHVYMNGVTVTHVYCVN